MIPLPLYTPIYYNILLIIVLVSALACLLGNRQQQVVPSFHAFSWLFLVFIIFYMGLRPISGIYFGDTANYARTYLSLQQTIEMTFEWSGEWVFYQLMYFCSQFMDVSSWFLIIATLYVGLAALAFRITHKNYAYFAFLMCVVSFSFWPYGINGIRNGLATSLVLLGFACYEKNRWWTALIFVVAFGTHISVVIPIAAFVLTIFYKNPKIYLIGYGVAILLSAAFGGWWEALFLNLGVLQDERLQYYLTTEVSTDEFSHTGFRWDFLFYSLWPIVLGAYYIFKKNYQDSFYLQLFNAYVATNACWILVIRAHSSNRFAYLSWFMMSWVIIYPLLKERLFIRQNKVVANTLVTYFAFTYLLFLLGK